MIRALPGIERPAWYTTGQRAGRSLRDLTTVAFPPLRVANPAQPRSLADLTLTRLRARRVGDGRRIPGGVCIAEGTGLRSEWAVAARQVQPPEPSTLAGRAPVQPLHARRDLTRVAPPQPQRDLFQKTPCGAIPKIHRDEECMICSIGRGDPVRRFALPRCAAPRRVGTRSLGSPGWRYSSQKRDDSTTWMRRCCVSQYFCQGVERSAFLSGGAPVRSWTVAAHRATHWAVGGCSRLHRRTATRDRSQTPATRPCPTVAVGGSVLRKLEPLRMAAGLAHTRFSCEASWVCRHRGSPSDTLRGTRVRTTP